MAGTAPPTDLRKKNAKIILSFAPSTSIPHTSISTIHNRNNLLSFLRLFPRSHRNFRLTFVVLAQFLGETNFSTFYGHRCSFFFRLCRLLDLGTNFLTSVSGAGRSPMVSLTVSELCCR
jgi:hypothetical protein